MKTINRFLWKKVHGMGKRKSIRNSMEDLKYKVQLGHHFSSQTKKSRVLSPEGLAVGMTAQTVR